MDRREGRGTFHGDLADLGVILSFEAFLLGRGEVRHPGVAHRWHRVEPDGSMAPVHDPGWRWPPWTDAKP